MEEMRNRKPEEKRQLGRPRRRWEDNTGTNLMETEWKGVYWMQLVQNREQWRALINTVMNFRVPYKAVSFLNR
jgi:hypothetical protein